MSEEQQIQGIDQRFEIPQEDVSFVNDLGSGTITLSFRQAVLIYSCVFTEFKADFISAADIQRHVMIRMLVSVDRGQRLQISTACLKTQRDCTTSQIVYKRHVFLWYFKTLINGIRSRLR